MYLKKISSYRYNFFNRKRTALLLLLRNHQKCQVLTTVRIDFQHMDGARNVTTDFKRGILTSVPRGLIYVLVVGTVCCTESATPSLHVIIIPYFTV